MKLSRSEMMRRIRGSDTRPEVELRDALERRGVPYRPEERAPVGRPDLVFAESRVAVFVDGCFWHGCPLHYARPRSREEFWSSKLVENLERDARQCRALEQLGWRVLRVWEHQIVEDLKEAVRLVEHALGAPDSTGWTNQRRVRRVVEIDRRVERREVVLLGAPEEVVDEREGSRVTAKARRRQR